MLGGPWYPLGRHLAAKGIDQLVEPADQAIGQLSLSSFQVQGNHLRLDEADTCLGQPLSVITGLDGISGHHLVPAYALLKKRLVVNQRYGDPRLAGQPRRGHQAGVATPKN